MVDISTSLLSVKKEKIIDTVYKLEDANTNYFHIDVMDGEFVEPPAPVVDGNGDALIPGAVVLVLVPACQGRHEFQGDISPLHSVQPGFIRRGEGGGMGDDIACGGDDHQGASQVMGSPVGDPVQLLSIQRGLDQFPFELFIHSGSSLCCQPKISFTF